MRELKQVVLDIILWDSLGITDRVIIWDTLRREWVDEAVTADELERFHRGNLGGIAAKLNWLNEHEPGERFIGHVLPPGERGESPRREPGT